MSFPDRHYLEFHFGKVDDEIESNKEEGIIWRNIHATSAFGVALGLILFPEPTTTLAGIVMGIGGIITMVNVWHGIGHNNQAKTGNTYVYEMFGIK